MFAFFVVLLILGFFAERWSIRNALKGIYYDTHPSQPVVEIGEKFSIITTITNKSRRFVPFLKISEEVPLDMGASPSAVSTSFDERSVKLSASLYLMPHQKVTRKYEGSLPARGRYFLRGATMFGGDFLGLNETVGYYSLLREIVVLPARRTAPDIVNILGGFLGDVSVNRFILEDPVLTLGFREYTGREPQKMISWPATLRAGRMMVKNYDYTIELSVTVVLNIDSETAGSVAHERMEVCYSLTRSVIEALEEKQVKYSFVTNAVAAGSVMPFRFVSEGLGYSHRMAILEGLGRATYSRSETWDELSDRLLRRAEAGRAHILITPENTVEHQHAIARLRDLTGEDVLVINAQEVLAQ